MLIDATLARHLMLSTRQGLANKKFAGRYHKHGPNLRQNNGLRP